jgi:DNA-binding NtrC family response regulator
MLNTAGYESKPFAGGEEVLELLASGEQCHLLLTDLLNSPMDGLSLLLQLKEKFPDITVIMSTAVHDISVALVCHREGAYDILLQPFERDQLLFAVSRALEHQRLKVENRFYRESVPISAAHGQGPEKRHQDKILVVHDDEVLFEKICLLLGEAGYQCRGASKCLFDSLHCDESFDLIVSNLFELLWGVEYEGYIGYRIALTRNTRSSDVPIIVVSSDPSDFHTCIRMGAFDHIQVPFEKEWFLAMVRRALEFSRLIRENQQFTG